MGKMVVLKPVVWNDKGYTWPAGILASSGYSQQHGYGHEEWNGRSDWVWRGWKLFHTEAKRKMNEYAEEGRLGIIMTTVRNGEFFAVGVGCAVVANKPEDNAEIARSLQLAAYAEALWQVPEIQERKASRAAFDRHWQAHIDIRWRCPQSHFAWFREPIRIVPDTLIPSIAPAAPRQSLIKLHSSYQAIRPDQALAIVSRALASDHPIIGWLSTDDFDPLRDKSVQNAPPPRDGRRSAATPTNLVTRYMQEYEIVVSPRHHILQRDFKTHLKGVGARMIREDVASVDLRFRHPDHGSVLVEIKPTEPATIRYAIRTAMGQLLDYHQRAKGMPKRLIVIDNEPSEEDRAMALTNGFAIAWRDADGFAWHWPGKLQRSAE